MAPGSFLANGKLFAELRVLRTPLDEPARAEPQAVMRSESPLCSAVGVGWRFGSPVRRRLAVHAP
jgi:hypothetical protein